ncbi:hypothetical protein PHYBLDRAFT_170406 [Phycomyces blakesleeanus NRRL 1555(-)]|uniref:Uncharacterized protein n=1 Tax=Phycomyces blakesleeanus (strain ATCC 8743b / DSM 1359 / FGSC 10004 / NBRC 33097 / NRRL 1555) TaxID=763407 RepID=A0A162X040_PHYB8|nr:hypothetical protein PHYBLDRAFT_170406 [Phycomyces blakesleeanus NRRL 1555(-)]OAD71745.1 hypothetical protein PHYBLDRAFT_170406 [Phycomyces blakesleeanus NRRL 1555(-)]|eukprot:XP_018289785.1 hypothetical protein PHYBLDRAFT_170406 [Phycomyces blakesleeanus NRRL 1555(-)]
MVQITKISSHECSSCHLPYNSSSNATKCQNRSLKTLVDAVINGSFIQDVSLPVEIQSIPAPAPSLIVDGDINMISDENMDIVNRTENDEPMYDADMEHDNTMEKSTAIEEIEDATAPLVFDFSQPLPTPSTNDAKNLEFIQIVKEFGISCNAHEKIASHFNEILASSTSTYRACTPYLGKELLKRFSRIEKKTYDVCCNGCMLFDANETECPHCSEDHYKSAQDNDKSSRRGLTGQSPLATLDAFSRPYFFALDEMHGICYGVAKQVWGLVTGKYRKKHLLVLSVRVQKEIGAAMALTRKTIPTLFYGAWRDVSKNAGYFKAVDWADFLLFAVPTLVAEQIRNISARKALLGLVQVCNLLMSWELSAEEQASIKRQLIEWNVYLETLLAEDKVDLKVFTINQHLLQHYLDMTEAFGLPRSYSARLVEKAIGKYSNAIKSNSATRTNAGNIMLGLAQTRQGEECSLIEAAIQTSCKAFVNSYVIDSALDQNCIQVDENHNIGQSYSPIYKDFFGKVVVFFEHKLNNKRWPLALVHVYAIHETNGIPVMTNVPAKPKVVHLADVKELVSLVVSTATNGWYIVWPELNCGPKLLLGCHADI